MTSKVRRFRAVLPSVAAALLLAVAACGCESSDEPSEDGTSAAPVASRFGDAYEIVLGESPADPDMPPAVLDDTLRALVAYSGGCDDHDFDLVHETARDTSRLWLRHDAHGDDCEARISDQVRLAVPADALDAPHVVLDNPQGGPPFVLRW